mgnify:CR=1 FL=1
METPWGSGINRNSKSQDLRSFRSNSQRLDWNLMLVALEETSEDQEGFNNTVCQITDR